MPVQLETLKRGYGETVWFSKLYKYSISKTGTSPDLPDWDDPDLQWVAAVYCETGRWIFSRHIKQYEVELILSLPDNQLRDWFQDNFSFEKTW